MGKKVRFGSTPSFPQGADASYLQGLVIVEYRWTGTVLSVSGRHTATNGISAGYYYSVGGHPQAPARPAAGLS